jgi:hypothetical protein
MCPKHEKKPKFGFKEFKGLIPNTWPIHKVEGDNLG